MTSLIFVFRRKKQDARASRMMEIILPDAGR
jgi:hypothetical protein